MGTAMTQDFDVLAEDFLSHYFAVHPTQGTAVGFHDYDDRLEEWSEDALTDWRRQLQEFRRRLPREITLSERDRCRQADVVVLEAAINGELLGLDLIRWWALDPSVYCDLACWSVYSLLARDYAPWEKRARAACHRLAAIPHLLDQARENLLTGARLSGEPGLRGIPAIYVDIACHEFAGAKLFFDSVVPLLAEQNTDDQALSSQLRQASARAAQSCQDMLDFLQRELRPHAQGTFALGSDLFRRLLRCQEQVTTPVEEILRRGYELLRATQKEMHSLAARISFGSPLASVLERLADDHPSAENLIHSYQRRCREIKGFVQDRELVTIPPDDDLRIVETPPFYRSLIFAALDPPGAFDPDGLPTFFYVTPTDMSSSPDEQREYLRAHNEYAQVSTIIHEAYPGHHVQALHRKRTPSRLRKIFGAGTFVEGWAHYCEQMVLDEGYGDEDPRLRLFQLHEALWRIGRLIVGTQMHIANWSLDQGIEFLVAECYQQRDNARREVWRYTRDPLVLVYAWGKWQIEALREAYRRHRGPRFSLRDFHDELLSHGEPSVTLLRFLLLGDTMPPPVDDGEW
jgi:uncharacterized protein (DUF885 family)